MSTVERPLDSINGARADITGRDMGLLGLAEPITAFPGEREVLLERTEEKQGGPPFGRRKPRR
jgi:hypothetical protein